MSIVPDRVNLMGLNFQAALKGTTQHQKAKEKAITSNANHHFPKDTSIIYTLIVIFKVVAGYTTPKIILWNHDRFNLLHLVSSGITRRPTI